MEKERLRLLVNKYIYDLNAWKTEIDEGDFTAHTMTIPELEKESSIKAVKVVARLPYHFGVVHEAVHDPTLKKILEPEYCVTAHLVEEFTPLHQIIYMESCSPVSMIGNRDFVIERNGELLKDANGQTTGYHWYNQSIKHEKCPERSGVTRGRAVIQGLRVEAHPLDSSHTQYIFFQLIDIQGWIPSYLINAGTPKMARLMLNTAKDGIPRTIKHIQENKKESVSNEI